MQGLKPLLLLSVLLATPPGVSRAQEDPALVNLSAAKKYEAAEIAVEVRDRNLGLGGLQIGTWPNPAEPLDLASIDDVRPPCRDLRSDGVGGAFAVVCPDAQGRDRLLLVMQGVVLRFPDPVAPGSHIGLSDDGARAAAMFVREDGPQLTLLDIHRTREITVHGLTEPRDPILAGPGTTVACTATVEGEPRALAVDLEFAIARVISEGLDLLQTVAVSANGRRVVFLADDHGLPNYYLVDVDRKKRFNITAGQTDGNATIADLAQHGDAVAYLSRFGGAMGLFVADINARKVLNVCGFFQPLEDVAISATGTRIAVVKGGAAAEVAIWDTEGKEGLEAAKVVGDFDAVSLSSNGLVLAALAAARGVRAAQLETHPLPVRE